MFTKSLQFDVAPTAVGAEILLYHTFANLSIGKMHKIFNLWTPEICAFCRLTNPLLCGTIYTVKGRVERKQAG